MLRVLIVDDEPLARRRLEILLKDQSDVTVVGAAADGLEARRLIDDLAPDLLVRRLRAKAGLNA